MRVAVVGHVEWVSFLDVDHVPRPGEIVESSGGFEEAAGGGGVAAVQLARLAGTATFFTAVGDDDTGLRTRARLEELGVEVRAAVRRSPQRRAVTLLDRDAERTIVTAGPRLFPAAADDLGWDDLAGFDAVYVTAGDAAAIRAARAARVVVATPRTGPALSAASVQLDALVFSADDTAEREAADAVRPPPALVVATAGGEGGRFTAAEGTAGTFAATPLPGPAVDAYGAGDTFAAGLTLALGRAQEPGAALAFAARCGAACLAGRGPYGGELGAL